MKDWKYIFGLIPIGILVGLWIENNPIWLKLGGTIFLSGIIIAIIYHYYK